VSNKVVQKSVCVRVYVCKVASAHAHAHLRLNGLSIDLACCPRRPPSCLCPSKLHRKQACSVGPLTMTRISSRRAVKIALASAEAPRAEFEDEIH
jgi:hypothetical protein